MTFPVDECEKQALRSDIQTLLMINSSAHIRACGMRAFVLLSLYIEEETALQVAACSPEDKQYVKDMRERVLPVMVPLYMDKLAQRPDIFVQLSAQLHRRWSEEPLQYLHSNLMPTAPLDL